MSLSQNFPMKIKVSYSESQLEACIKFISANNETFRGKDEAIRQSLRRSIQNLIDGFPNSTMSGTMGYFVSVADIVEEGIEDDQNEMFLEFTVDPGVGKKNWTDDDYHSEVVDVKK